MFSDALPFFFSVEVFVFHICGHTGGWQFGPLSVLCLPRPASQCRAVPYQCLKKHTVPPDGSSRRLRRHSTIVFAVLRCLTVCLALCGAFHCSSFCPAFCFFRLVPYFFCVLFFYFFALRFDAHVVPRQGRFVGSLESWFVRSVVDDES